MRDLIATNRRQWDERTPIHVHSPFYDLESFKGGRPLAAPSLGEDRFWHLAQRYDLPLLFSLRARKAL